MGPVIPLWKVCAERHFSCQWHDHWAGPFRRLREGDKALPQYCTNCHGETKQKRDLRMDTLVVDLSSPKIMAHWEEIMNRINSGDVPPDDVEKRPKPEDASRVAEWIATPLRETEVVRQSSGARDVSETLA